MDDFPFPVKIKTIDTAKRLKLRVLPNGDVVVTCHPLTPKRYVREFVLENQDWVSEKRSAVLEKLGALTETRETLLYRGKVYQFRIQVSTSSPKRIELQEDKIIAHVASENHQAIRFMLEDWYKDQAKKYFEKRVLLLADVVDKGVVRVNIRDQHTRWGSCSSRRTISLNWRLLQAPDWVSDYVIYHELAHLTHMNHSNRFWQLVTDYCPNYKEAEKWLKKHHSLLHF